MSTDNLTQPTLLDVQDNVDALVHEIRVLLLAMRGAYKYAGGEADDDALLRRADGIEDQAKALAALIERVRGAA
jgi:nitrogen-specific signal transduction histidine kinase